MSIEKIGAWTAVLAAVVTIVFAWANLNHRVNEIGNQVAAMQEAAPTSACLAILGRQIEAIEKARDPAREQLESLSDRYHCVPTPADLASYETVNEALHDDNAAFFPSDAYLVNALQAVDVILANGQ